MYAPATVVAFLVVCVVLPVVRPLYESHTKKTSSSIFAIWNTWTPKLQVLVGFENNENLIRLKSTKEWFYFNSCFFTQHKTIEDLKDNIESKEISKKIIFVTSHTLFVSLTDLSRCLICSELCDQHQCFGFVYDYKTPHSIAKIYSELA